MSDRLESDVNTILALESLTGEILLASGTLRKVFNVAGGLIEFASLLQGLKASSGISEMTHEAFADEIVPLIQTIIEKSLSLLPIDIISRHLSLQKHLLNLLAELSSITQELNIPFTFPEGMTMQ